VLRLAAPAKINLHLEILGRRADGYHELETLFQTVELHDVVGLALEPGQGIHLVCSDPSLPSGSENLAWRAAQQFLDRRPLPGRVVIHLEKRTPAGAGLGGGSSDAATVLRGLNRLTREPLPAPELHALALALGSDVPFFLTGGTCHGLGRGEVLSELPDLPRLAVTVLKPHHGLATPAVFKALTDEERGPRKPQGATWFRENLAYLPCPPLCNRLTGPAMRLEPQVRDLLAWLAAHGVSHLLSGSGSACFAFAHLDPPTGVRAWKTWFRPRQRLDALDQPGWAR
jgi:4-diphosphocytidyl-2-C-methyl-D-erythritol kinase